METLYHGPIKYQTSNIATSHTDKTIAPSSQPHTNTHRNTLDKKAISWSSHLQVITSKWVYAAGLKLNCIFTLLSLWPPQRSSGNSAVWFFKKSFSCCDSAWDPKEKRFYVLSFVRNLYIEWEREGSKQRSMPKYMTLLDAIE